MAFDAYDRSVELLRSLAPLISAIASFDSSLADQLRRAAHSALLNVAEGRGRTGRDQRNRYRIANGSAYEVRAALDIATCSGYLDEAQLVSTRAILDRVCALTWSLANR